MLADTGYWLALANPNDAWHGAAVTATQHLTEPLVVTWPVVTETCHLLGRYGGVDAQVGFLSLLSSAADICQHRVSDAVSMGALMAKYRDLPMDLADASLVAAASAVGSGRILTTDERDFGIYRWNVNEPFENMLAPHRNNGGMP